MRLRQGVPPVPGVRLPVPKTSRIDREEYSPVAPIHRPADQSECQSAILQYVRLIPKVGGIGGGVASVGDGIRHLLDRPCAVLGQSEQRPHPGARPRRGAFAVDRIAQRVNSGGTDEHGRMQRPTEQFDPRRYRAHGTHDPRTEEVLLERVDVLGQGLLVVGARGEVFVEGLGEAGAGEALVVVDVADGDRGGMAGGGFVGGTARRRIR
mmetsp:Transcript_12145/g.35527  ORF Transcript_12145/g.35527 Transcript_12145/m.35527 type:complete len:209 (+) Transcript_12145:874-1500(+)